MLISCKKATYFVSMSHETKLRTWDFLRMKIHVFVCKPCKTFDCQTKSVLPKFKDYIACDKLTDAQMNGIESRLKNSGQ